MKLELNMPKFQMPEFRQINPLGNESVKALAIVIGAIIVISAAVYSAQSLLPAQTEVEVGPSLRRITSQPTVTAIPTATPTVIPREEPVETWEELPAATASPALTY